MIPRSSSSFAGCRGFAHSGSMVVGAQPAATNAAIASGSDAAGRMKVSVPRGRSGRARAVAQTASSPAGACFAARRDASGDGVPAALW